VITKNIRVFAKRFCEYRCNKNSFAELEPVLCSHAGKSQTLFFSPLLSTITFLCSHNFEI
jgi:hypothetical protein